MVYTTSLVSFLTGLVVSAIIIYFVSSAFGKKRGLKTAFLAAAAGSIIYTLSSIYISVGLVATFVGGVVWLFALKHFYGIGWLKALLIAVFIWAAANIVNTFLPTVAGPL
ncbi:MAG: hypothetical protein ACLFTQ_02455 [Candidatus Aenigmatarchaeota archaeon]